MSVSQDQIELAKRRVVAALRQLNEALRPAERFGLWVDAEVTAAMGGGAHVKVQWRRPKALSLKGAGHE